ncbi:hypothetical protein HN51_028540 [Arachis hypogaea]
MPALPTRSNGQSPTTKPLSRSTTLTTFSPFDPLIKGSKSDSDEEDQRSHRKDKSNSNLLSYGLTIALKGQKGLLRELDIIFQSCGNFSVHKVFESSKKKGEVLDG